jgi:hypothetical protein
LLLAYYVDSASFLNAGDIICFLHAEQEKFLMTNTSAKKVVFLSSTAESGDNSEQILNSNSLWEVELQNPARGGVCQWTDRFRFRHIGTGNYLAVSTKTVVQVPMTMPAVRPPPRHLQRQPQQTDIPSAQPMSEHQLAPLTTQPDMTAINTVSSGKQEKVYELTTTNDYLSPSTLFVLHATSALDPENMSDIPKKSIVWIQHHLTGTWICSTTTTVDGASDNKSSRRSLGRSTSHTAYKVSCSLQQKDEGTAL